MSVEEHDEPNLDQLLASSRLATARHRHSSTMEALRELVVDVVPHLEAQEQSELPHAAIARSAGLKGDAAEELETKLKLLAERVSEEATVLTDEDLSGRELMRELMEEYGDYEPRDPPDFDDPIEATQWFAREMSEAEGESRVAQVLRLLGRGTGGLIDVMDEVLGRDSVMPAAIQMSRTVYKPSHARTIVNATLTNAVTSLEAVVSEVVRARYTVHPEALGPRDTSVSLSELRQLGTYDRVLEEVIERRVEQVSHDSLDGLDSWLSKELDASFEELGVDFDVLTEIYERRHVIVHHSGRVSRRYVDRIKDTDCRIGQELESDPDYALKALMTVNAAGQLLALAAARKLRADQSLVADIARDVSAWVMNERWGEVELLTGPGVIRAAKLENEGLAATLHVNHWLAMKRQYGIATVRREIENWEPSIGAEYQMARSALLGDAQSAAQYARLALEDGNVTCDELAIWPVLEDVRESPEWQRVDEVCLDS